MAHIRYNNQSYRLPEELYEQVRESIFTALTDDGVVCIDVSNRKDGSGKSSLYITRGVAVSLHDWDLEDGDESLGG